MGKLRGTAFGLGLWLLSSGLLGCAGGAGQGRQEGERTRATGAERQRPSPERGAREVVSGSGRSDGSSRDGSEPGTVGSNTNWRPIEPWRPNPLDPDDPEAARDAEERAWDEAEAEEGGAENGAEAVSPGEGDPAPAGESSAGGGADFGAP